MQVQIIDEAVRLYELEEEWREFQRNVPPATPFQTPDWLLPWWRHFGSGRLRIFVFRTGGSVAGILPCFLHQWNGRRQLTLLGTGISDYLDPLLGRHHRDEMIDALQRELTAFPDWDLCDWQDLSEDTPLARLGELQEDTPCASLAIGPVFEVFLKNRPSYLRRNLRHSREAAVSVGDLQFAVSTHAEPDLINCLIEQHSARWEASGESGMIVSNHAAAFLRDAAPALAESDLLRIFSLRLDHQVVAIILALRNDETIFGYLSAFHPAYRKYGFGSELLLRSLRYAHEHGYEWSFLRGDEQYKFDWGARRIPKRRVVIRRSL